MSEIAKEIAKAITEEPIVFEITPRRSFPLSMLARLGIIKKVRQFSIYPATLGMINQMAEYSENMIIGGVATINEALSSVNQNSMDLCRFLAVAILRTNGPIARIRINLLARFLHRNLTSKNLSALLDAVVKQSDVAFFLSIMASVGKKQAKEKTESPERSTAPHGELQEVQ